MQKAELRKRLSEELDRWCGKSYESLRVELQDVVNYERGEGENRYQVEVQLIEDTPEYVHVMLSVDDGGWRAFVPISTDFLVYRDGRVDRPEIE